MLRDLAKSNPDRAGAAFPTTHWSMVVEASASEASSALEKLCRDYWYPLYVFIRRRGYDAYEAQDLTQEFFARLLSGDSLQSIHPDKGRFRTFLLAVLKNFLAKEWRDANRIKRGGGTMFLPWDELNAEGRYAEEQVGDSDNSPEAAFDRKWAQTIVDGALQQLRREYERERAGERFNVLQIFLQGNGTMSYAEAAERTGLSEGAAKSAIFRLRRRYSELVRASITETVQSPEDVEEEIRHFIAVLASG